jgi:hypothetical protein
MDIWTRMNLYYDDDVYLDKLQTRGVAKCISSTCET